MKKILINLKKELEKDGFNFDASKTVYNPMERFADYVSTKEIVHSRIIADLFNPAGEHQLGNGFLLKFLQELGIEIKAQSSPNAENPIKIDEISTEHSAPAKLDGIESNGRIDIFIRLSCSGKDYVIIIENKLNDAVDQPQQLKRYNQYVRERFKYIDNQIYTVYLPRIGDDCDYEGVKVINATDLASLIEKAVEESISPSKASIQAYANYLRNISINNMIMDNATILSNLEASYIQDAKAIKEAYDLLPQAFALHLKTVNDGKEKGCKAEISADYSHYCYIWKEDAYKATGLWLAVGFYHDHYRIYVVSNDESKLKDKGYDSTLHIIRSENTKDQIWLIPQEKTDFEVNFKGSPNFEKLQEKINKWLRKLGKLVTKYEDSSSL